MGKKELSDTPLTDAVLDHIRRMQDNMSYGDLLMIQHAERMERGRAELLKALGALGVIGGGYCFCSGNRDPDKQDHEPECRDARAAIAKATGANHE